MTACYSPRKKNFFSGALFREFEFRVEHMDLVSRPYLYRREIQKCIWEIVDLAT